MNKAALGLKLRQAQQLSRNLQQSLRVLHMSAQALEDEVAAWLDENPFLEKTDDADTIPQYTQTAGHAHIGGDQADDVWATVADEPCLNRLLHMQVCEHPLDKNTAARVHVLIDSLDDQGYLADSLDDIIDNAPLDWLLDEDNLGAALAALQRFDPPGIGARDLTESLLLQLARHPEDDINHCAAHLVRHHLGQWQNASQQKQLLRSLPQFDNPTFQAALTRIGTLNPYPAYGLAASQPTAYIRPDIVIHNNDKGWQIDTVKAAWPQLRLNADYAKQMTAANLDPACKRTWQEAQSCLDSLQLRQNTVLRLAQWILEQQQDFFIFGPIGLVPLTLKETAHALGLAESTVSRAVNQKYLACPQGMFALRYFFSQAVSQNEHNTTGNSQQAVKTLLGTLIAQEDAHKPYSDTELVAHLAKHGITLARRTVAKYREELKIAPVHQRRQRG